MKRACLASSVAVAFLALAAGPVLAQGRPSESGSPRAGSNPGSNSGAATRGGGGGSSGGGGGSSVGSSGGGSSSAPSGGGVSGGRERAVPRSGAPERRTPSAVGRGSGGSSATSEGGRGKGPDTIGPIREVPEYGRPRGNRPTTGTAVARSEMPFTRPEWFQVYRNAFPYGVYYPGYWGAGYFYYDPFWWGDPYYYGGYPYYGGYGGYYGGGYGRSSYYGDYGRLRLKVKPREAQVYVDGYFSGLVDQFDGVFQRLALRAGAHRIEIRAEGYEPLAFEVLITPHETVTYTGSLKPR